MSYIRTKPPERIIKAKIKGIANEVRVFSFDMTRHMDSKSRPLELFDFNMVFSIDGSDLVMETSLNMVPHSTISENIQFLDDKTEIEGI